jgi:hypothetical protein
LGEEQENTNSMAHASLRAAAWPLLGAVSCSQTRRSESAYGRTCGCGLHWGLKWPVSGPGTHKLEGMVHLRILTFWALALASILCLAQDTGGKHSFDTRNSKLIVRVSTAGSSPASETTMKWLPDY